MDTATGNNAKNAVVNYITHYQRSIEKSLDNEERLLHCLQKLYNYEIQVPHLQSTGIGRTVNSLRKRPGQVGDTARHLVAKWKDLVNSYDSSDDEHTDRSNGVKRPPKEAGQVYVVSSTEDTSDKNEKIPSSKKSSEHRNHESSKSSSHSEHQSSHGKSSSSHDRKSSSRSHESRSHSEHGKSSSRHHSSSKSNRSENSPSKSSSKGDSHSKYSKDSSKINVKVEKKSKSDEKSDRKKDSEFSNNQMLNQHHSTEIRHNENKKSKSDNSYKHESSKSISFEEALAPKVFKHKKESSKKKSTIKMEAVSVANDQVDLPLPKFAKQSTSRKTTDTESGNEFHSSKRKDVTDSKKIKIKMEPVEESFDNGYDSAPGTSFEDALGFIETNSPSKSKKDKKKKSQGGLSSNNLVKPLPKSEELTAFLDLPAINQHYRPLPQLVVRQQQQRQSVLDPLTSIMSSKPQRTKVYSGIKSFHGEVPTLQDMCIEILQDNLDALEDIGYAPFFLMEPVLARASAAQLANIERYNPRLSEDTDELWHTLVQSEFKGANKNSGECWRDVYERSQQEREDKLGSLMARIKHNEAQKIPQRTTKLAYVNSQVKPPRNVQRQQLKHGTSRGSLPAPVPPRLHDDDIPGPSGLSSHASTLARTVGMLRDGPSMSIKSRKRPAPLMQKTLKFMKTNFRR